MIMPALTGGLKRAGFKPITRSTHEMNSLYDLPGQKLRKRGELLRLRKYGETWVLTHKAKSKSGRHKVRVELETRVENGQQMDAILRALGFAPTFRYEKYRARVERRHRATSCSTRLRLETSARSKGPSRWIDRTARALGITPGHYITQTYAELFFEWKRRLAAQPPR